MDIIKNGCRICDIRFLLLLWNLFLDFLFPFAVNFLEVEL